MHRWSSPKLIAKTASNLARSRRVPRRAADPATPDERTAPAPHPARMTTRPRDGGAAWRQRSTADRRLCEALPRRPHPPGHSFQEHLVDLVVEACRAARREARRGCLMVVIVFAIGPRVVGVVVDPGNGAPAPASDAASERAMVLVDIEQLMSSIDVARFAPVLH